LGAISNDLKSDVEYLRNVWKYSKSYKENLLERRRFIPR